MSRILARRTTNYLTVGDFVRVYARDRHGCAVKMVKEAKAEMAGVRQEIVEGRNVHAWDAGGGGGMNSKFKIEGIQNNRPRCQLRGHQTWAIPRKFDARGLISRRLGRKRAILASFLTLNHLDFS
jgi:hypothetical protein